MRTIILSPGFDFTLYWRDAIGQGRIDEAALPLSKAMRQRLDDYYKHYSELYFDTDSCPVSALDKRLLDDAGLEIWRQLRMELNGQYEVQFHSDEFSCPFASPEEFLTARNKA